MGPRFEARCDDGGRVLLDVAHPHLIDTAGMELDETLLIFNYLHGQAITVLRPAPPSPIGPSGAAASLLREAFLEVGGFDETLFAYWDDVDLVLRLRETGSECCLVPEARALRAHSSTLGSGSSREELLDRVRPRLLAAKVARVEGRKAARALALDAAICLGQMAIDRNAAGFRGRAHGWRAASSVSSRDLPAAINRTLPPADLLREVRRRARRRSRLRIGGSRLERARTSQSSLAGRATFFATASHLSGCTHRHFRGMSSSWTTTIATARPRWCRASSPESRSSCAREHRLRQGHEHRKP